MLTERVASLAADPPTLLERDGLFRRAPKQRRLYEALENHDDAQKVYANFAIADDVLARLAQ